MGRRGNTAETEYERAFTRWEYTPKWRVIARRYRKREWKLWLKANDQPDHERTLTDHAR